jgi:hypothetical protein
VQFDNVVEVKVTVKFDEAVALTVNGDSERSRLVRDPKVIVWFDLLIVKVVRVGLEAFQVLDDAAVEVNSHVPAEVHERAVPEILQVALPISATS